MEEIEKKRGRGRPKTGQIPSVTIRLTPEANVSMRELLDTDETPSDFIRLAVDREIARRKRGR